MELQRWAGHLVWMLLLITAGCGGGGGGDSGSTGGTGDSSGGSANVPPMPLTGTLTRTDLPSPTILSATPSKLDPFVAFESGQVRPLSLSADGSNLLAVNTPDNRLEVFAITNNTLAHTHSVPVGMEPVAVAVSGDQAWVVNHLSDSVSVVSFAHSPPRVIRTLLLGDEPRDIVFAGPEFSRAFITTAHRGQNHPRDARLNTAAIGRADVWVFERDELGAELGGSPLQIITLFGDTPRALARTADGSRVYAAVLNSGNRTTVVRDVPTTDKAPPFASADGVTAPLSALILKYNGRNWVDERGVVFDNRASLNLPDTDVFELDAMATVPAQTRNWSTVGTTLFNLAVSPISGSVLVSNTDARNQVRFEGPGNGASTVRGHVTDNRISVLREDGTILRVDLNSHIDRTRELGTAQERALSLALPLEMSVSDDGSTLYLVAMGSNKVAAINLADLEGDRFDPADTTHIQVSGGGPTGIVLDEARGQAFVMTRYDNGISVIDLATAQETAHVQMFNPEPASIVEGRRFLYDASITSSTGDSACASCHIFGDTDHLAWDLGNPDEEGERNPFSQVPFTQPNTGNFRTQQTNFHPMKGPKGTQSLRGMPNHGPLHWRGDRTGTNPVDGEPREAAAFKEFNKSFQILLGRELPLEEAEMQAFTDFAMQLSYPPNPHRPLDNVLTPDQQEGRRVYTNVFTSPGGTVGCNTCHVLDAANGHFGAAGNLIAVLGANEQDFKVPHFRNIYQKVGFFRGGLSQPQIRGFGLSEPGSTPGLMALVNSGDFQFETDRQPEQLAAFIFAYDTVLAPIVGQQITLGSEASASAEARVDLLMARAQVTGRLPECDLVVKGVWDGEVRGAVRLEDDTFQSDRQGEILSLEQLKILAGQDDNHLTFTCTPPNSGLRMGADRDEDGVFDRDEL